MCDLIDLKSPDGKKIAGTKLTSPLIPIPSTATTNDDKKNVTIVPNTSSDLNFEKRNSLDNNPFDNAHHKTVEYVRKQEDPFEVVLEKALMYNERRAKSSTSKAGSVEFKDDFTPKKRRYSDILKMNKTLDDSLTDLALNNVCEMKKKLSLPIAEEKEIEDSHSGEGKMSDVEAKFQSRNDQIIPKICVESVHLDTSILNQSAMNDSLTESSGSVDENRFKSVTRLIERIRVATRDPSFLAVNDEIPKSHKLRRSQSQGDNTSPRKFRQYRSHSIVDGLKAGEQNDDSSFFFCVPSIVSENSLNRGFCQTANNASVLSNLSNISAITRLTSVSSGFNSSYSSSVFSNRTANCAFIETSTSNGMAGNITDIADDKCVDEKRLGSNGSVTSLVKSPIKESRNDKDLDDLILKYSKLRTKTSESSTNEILPISRVTSNISDSEITVDKPICPKTEEKLIDVDVFVPLKDSSDSSQGKSISSTLSDSVFVDSDTIEKSIFSEAKHLAKTFEELAGKTGSSSTSSDDLVNSRLHWNFDMLPLSDDEVLVDDLIELPNSPGKCDIEKVTSPEERKKSASSEDAKLAKSMIKELETEFRDPEKKIIASTLLLDLEKLVKSEDNPKAAELLKSLEKALGVKCESNSDLLATCVSVRNDLTKSPKRNENSCGNENIKNENSEKSREDNSDIDTSESFKQLSLSDDKSLQNNLNIHKEINKSDKSLMLSTENYDDSTTGKRDNNGSKDSSGKIHDDSIDAIKQRNPITDDQKMAVEILVGLGKLLTGDNKDPLTSSLLKNLGVALNLASSNNIDHDVELRSSAKETKRTGTPVKNRVATPPRKFTPVSAFSRTSTRRSLESGSKTKATAERVMRRSISVTQTPTSTTTCTRIPNTSLSADKSKAHLKDGRKRFSSDPSSDIQTVNGRKLTKDIKLKPGAVSELARKDKPSSTIVGSVKNKFRKKTEPDFASKKGPMKAILPLGTMQRRGSLIKRESSLNGSVTPPKPVREPPSAFTVTTSTPFPIIHLSVAKKCSKSKPIASSTPDDIQAKHFRRSTSQIPQSPRKNSFSCEISPVTSKNSETNDENPALNSSMSSKTSKLVTPSKSRSASQLPKLSPMLGTKSSCKSNRVLRRSEPLQSILPRSLGTPKSPAERLASDGSTSPLNSSNKLVSKVKPMNLISKLRRRKASVAEKENYA